MDLPNYLNVRKLEPLAVIIIIAIIIAIVITPMLQIQTKVRDARRKGDLDAVKKALELAKQDLQGFYPPNLPPSTLEALGYIEKFPFDPQSPKTNYEYIPAPRGCTKNCATYKLTACLENAKDMQKDPQKIGCENYPASYTITNP